MGLVIGIAFVCLFLGLIGYISTRPDDFRLERSAQISAPSDVVFRILNDLRQWPRWSPWEKLDRNMTKTYAGPDAGPGASFAWVGNKKAGEGNVTILETEPGRVIAMRLVMLKPFAATNKVTFTVNPSGSGTHVSWAMEGKNNFMMKAVNVFASMDAMVGKDFEEGLANLNAAAQEQAPKS